MFSIRGLRFYFPALEPWVAWSDFTPRLSSLPVRAFGAAGCYPLLCLPRSPPLLSLALSVYLCSNVWPHGLLVLGLPAPFVPPPPVSVLPQLRESSLSRLPVSAPPTSLDECLFFISLVLDFLAVGFSVSSGCARRRSVFTYAAILVLLLIAILLFII